MKLKKHMEEKKMAKKVRFPLEMSGGVQVRSMEELRENFSLVDVMGYVDNGKLITWLNDRYETEIAETIELLNSDSKTYVEELCVALGVEYVEADSMSLEEIQERNEKIEKLKVYTDDSKYIEVINQVAFDQDGLYDLLDEDKQKIYLCGEKFSIPLGKKNVTYIGINNPMVVIASKEKVNFEEKGILLKGVAFDKAYQEVIQIENNSNNVIDDKEEYYDDIIEKPKFEESKMSTIANYDPNEFSISSEVYLDKYEGCNEVAYIPNGVIRIGKNAFEFCTDVRYVYIPESVEEICEGAFKGCVNLLYISLPPTVREIEAEVFSGCTSLKYAEILGGIKMIPQKAFFGCVSLKEITLSERVEVPRKKQTYNTFGSSFLGSIMNDLKTYGIEDCAFMNCRLLEKIEIPTWISYIGRNAFENCKKLNSVLLPDELNYLNDDVFRGCENLEKINIPYSLENIYDGVFIGCNKLKVLKISENTEIGYSNSDEPIFPENITIHCKRGSEVANYAEEEGLKVHYVL